LARERRSVRRSALDPALERLSFGSEAPSRSATVLDVIAPPIVVAKNDV
jgi:hypothetical protein